MSETESERAALLATARAYLEWEAEVSGFGLPPWQGVAAHAEPAQASPPAPSPALETARNGHGAVLESSIVAPSRERAAEASTAPSEEPRAMLAALAQRPSEHAVAHAVPMDRRVRLLALEESVRSCTRCELAKSRKHTVFARGNPDSSVVFIGEGPGQEEDRSGLPFVGPAGQLLDKMVAAMGFARDDVYICNVVKCRPPGNRTPLPSEAGACASYLLGQLDAIRPRVIVALGRCATENLGLVGAGGGWRGRWGTFQGIDVMPTYHPAFLLRSPEFKRPVWEDLQKVMSRLKQPA